jgi:hypothetical protein
MTFSSLPVSSLPAWFGAVDRGSSGVGGTHKRYLAVLADQERLVLVKVLVYFWCNSLVVLVNSLGYSPAS